MSQPTQREIAKASGVSQGLVSLVLNNADVDVAKATRLRILETAKRLGYTPKKNELRVRSKKNSLPEKGKVLAYIPRTFKREMPDHDMIYDAYEEFYAQFQNELVEAAYKKGFSLLVRPYENPSEFTHWLIEWGVDGVLMHARDKLLGEWIAKRYPMVQINHRSVSEADVVTADHGEIITMAMDHLYKQGHRHIAHIAKSAGVAANECRIQSYRDYTKKHDLHCYEEFLDYGSEEQMVESFFGHDFQPPTAVITGDSLAVILQQEAAKRGFSLPRDLSVIGIDNTALGRFASPPLTSVDVQIHEVAHTALALMMERLKEPSRSFRKVEIFPKLILRESVSSPAVNPKTQTSGIHQPSTINY